MQNYVSTAHDYETDQILIWERPVKGGERTLRMVPAPRYFYVPDADGEYTTITGVKVSKLVFDTEEEFKYAMSRHRIRYESDVRPEARALMDEYYDVPTPIIHYAFLDIEVDYSSKLGFSSPENPYAPINAITIYKSWDGTFSTYAVPPKGWKDDGTFQEKIKAAWAEHKLGFKPDVTICKDEKELLLYMLGDIEDADVLSGWNSEFFDIPYIVKRLERVLGKRGPGHLCFKGANPPREKIVNRFGAPATTYTLYGRTHLDYLDLFKKFTFEGRVSYSLANIAAEELDVPKLDYDGTLEQLYNRDFVHFITYNARDVEVLLELDTKFKLMNLVNQMAHENTVPFLAILGTVRYVETGVLNRAKRVHNLICNDKVILDEKNEKVEGAIVMTPRAGLWKWIGSVDLTSLYPSTARALNMSIDTFIGQFEDGEKAWDAIRKKDPGTEWTLDAGPGAREQKFTMTGAEWWQWLRDENFAISAFGTVFDQNKPGMLADTLTFWFTERKRLQAEKKKYAKLAREEKDPEKLAEYERLVEYYDLLQLTKKIQLNSAYGATLNEAFRFGRREIGASITGTGRQITTHMAQTIGRIVTGEDCVIEKRYAGRVRENGTVEEIKNEFISRKLKEDDFEWLRSNLSTVPLFVQKFDKETNQHYQEPVSAVYFTENKAIIYGDTDSCYFQTYAESYDEAVAVADEVARQVNESFPPFMEEAFNCTDGRQDLIKAAREVVAEAGVFLFAKKKYTLKVMNLDGADLRGTKDGYKLKSMGSEIKKADTPKVVQDFLKNLMGLVLNNRPYDELEKFVNSHRGSLIHRSDDLIALGSARQVNNLEAFYAAWIRGGKKDGKVPLAKDGAVVLTSVPGHVRAAINYNELVKEFDQGGSKLLSAGDKAIVFYLKPNDYGFSSIAFPSDMAHLPSWFDENFNIDLRVTETKMIDDKVSGIFEALGYEVPTPQRAFLKTMFTF